MGRFRLCSTCDGWAKYPGGKPCENCHGSGIVDSRIPETEDLPMPGSAAARVIAAKAATRGMNAATKAIKRITKAVR